MRRNSIAYFAGILALCFSCSRPEPSGDIVFERDSHLYRIPARGGEAVAVDGDYIENHRRDGDTLFSETWATYVDDEARLNWVPRPCVAPVVVSASGEAVGDFDVSEANGIVVYSCLPDRGRTRIIIVKSLPEGRILALFDSGKDDISPSIAPDGLWIAFQSKGASESSIRLGYLADGSEVMLVFGERPSWE